MNSKLPCPACGEEVESIQSGAEETAHYEPVNKKMLARKIDTNIPFACEQCGSIDFKFKAVRDVVFIFPIPKVERIGNIWIPDEVYVGGNPQERFREPSAYVLSVGRGGVDIKKRIFMDISGLIETGDRVVYQKRVPWEINLPASDGKKYKVIYCGIRDIYGTDE